MTTTAAAPAQPTHLSYGTECGYCGAYFQTDRGARQHMLRSCPLRDRAGINGHTATVRYSRDRSGQARLSLHCSCPAGAEGLSLHGHYSDAEGLDYVRALLRVHRSTGASLLDVANGDA